MPEALAVETAASTLAPRSPRTFSCGAVGLGIVAAMSRGGSRRPSPAIPILMPNTPAPEMRRHRPGAPAEEEEDDDEISECYTCAISRVGEKPVRKMVCLDKDFAGAGGDGGGGFFFESPAAAPVTFPQPSIDFLSCCYLCRKKLHGLEIFMYRGDKPYCSAECRFQQIISDEKEKKQWSKALKPLKLCLPSLLPSQCSCSLV